MLSDINFTSMVPELSRSADHLCHGEEKQNIDANDNVESYAKGPFLKTPDYMNQGCGLHFTSQSTHHHSREQKTDCRLISLYLLASRQNNAKHEPNIAGRVPVDGE